MRKVLQQLLDQYQVKPGMSFSDITDSFVADECAKRSEYVRRANSSPTAAKAKYWAQRATGLTTEGGKNRLKHLLMVGKETREHDSTNSNNSNQEKPLHGEGGPASPAPSSVREQLQGDGS